MLLWLGTKDSCDVALADREHLPAFVHANTEGVAVSWIVGVQVGTDALRYGNDVAIAIPSHPSVRCGMELCAHSDSIVTGHCVAFLPWLISARWGIRTDGGKPAVSPIPELRTYGT